MASEMSFPFPFPPYDVQKDFMKNLYNVLDTNKIGIFESPTGTGKSLSIICGSLKWLKDFQEKKKQELVNAINVKSADFEYHWFNDFLKQQEKRYALIDAKKEYEFIVSHESYLKNLKIKNVKRPSLSSCSDVKNSKFSRYDNIQILENQQDDDFAIENLESDNALANSEDKEEKPNILKIYFASRTHSQLAQFLGEVKRSPYNDIITVTILGSRANLCINESISKFKNVDLINEHCIELQQMKNKKSCPFIKSLSIMEDDILSSVKDIEDIVQSGKELKSCPYYASRNAISKVELVVLPYNILLHKPTREAYGITLKENIVIIDEAHNLVEAVNNMYSSEISGTCLEQSFLQLRTYYRCYCDRFSHKNLKFIKLLISVLKSLLDCLKSNPPSKDADSVSKMMSVNDFISFSAVANINFFELVEFCDTSLIGHKLHGFTMARVAKGITPNDDEIKYNICTKSSTSEFLSQIKQINANEQEEIKHVQMKENDIQYRPSAFYTFIKFIKSLTFPTEDGRVLFCKTPTLQKSFLKFLHLNPSSHFQEIVTSSKSIILAGGTMQPVSEFTDLFLNTGVPQERLCYFSCGHVIPPENLLAIGLAAGPCGKLLDFTYKSRKLPETVKELGSILINLSNSVKGGIVCFLPSYDYEEFIYRELEQNKMLDSIQRRKKIFREPKLSSNVDQVLSQYAKTISLRQSDSMNSCDGAILFSIVGGKMSEGINFSDDLGRCVVMVGLPYPNKFSIELKEKILYLNAKTGKNLKNAGDVYYNNLCMKAVNQSIGRAIRHKNDYATIILLDYRYNTSMVKNALPGWILKSYSFYEKFGPAYFAIRKFFSSRNQ